MKLFIVTVAIFKRPATLIIFFKKKPQKTPNMTDVFKALRSGSDADALKLLTKLASKKKPLTFTDDHGWTVRIDTHFACTPGV